MKKIAAILSLLLLIALPSIAAAATMSIVPSATSVSAGDIVTVRVVVNPSGVAINNAEAVLRFPPGILQVLSISKASSMFSLWVEEPSFSNGAGTVSFNGGVPNPGVSSPGTVFTISFSALRAGTASLSLTDAAVRANDGLGTNVLTSSSGTSLTITSVTAPAPQAPTPTPAPAPTEQPVARGPIQIASATHPDQEQWYKASNPTFSWDLPDGATAVQLGVDASATAMPSVSYTNPINEKQIDRLEDGIWYFRMRYRAGGVWSGVSTYRVKIDTTAPEVQSAELLFDENEDAVFVSVNAIDALSSVVGYEVRLDDGEPQIFNATELKDGSLKIPVRTSGVHRLTISAVDGAGNKESIERSFSVPPTLMNQTLFRIGSLNVSLIAVLVGMALVSLLSIAIAVLEWRTVLTYRSRRHPTIPAVRQNMHKAFLKIRENMEKDVRALDRARAKRELSKEEVALYRRLLENLRALERHLDQSLSDVE